MTYCITSDVVTRGQGRALAPGRTVWGRQIDGQFTHQVDNIILSHFSGSTLLDIRCKRVNEFMINVWPVFHIADK